MGPLGFGGRSLWLSIFDRDGRPLPALPRFDDVPARPERRMVHSLRTLIEGILGGALAEPELSAAFLLSRPGGAAMTADDEAWVQALADLPTHPLLIATDEAIVIPPAARAAA